MIFNFLSRVWTEFAPGLGNHLWQSTIFAALIAAVALAFRGNQARTRFWLWQAASLKFLFPFSLLVSAGSYFAIPRTDTPRKAVFYSAFEQIGQPFDAQTVTSIVRSSPAPSAVNPVTHYLPLLLIVWLLGSLAVLFVWLVRWRRIAAIAKNGTPLEEGPAAAIVAQLQERDAVGDKVAIVSTNATIEPGIFGIFRPVLLWPASISGQLTEAHTESIVAHELCHVRRRDNLTATLHMLVESLFWFHPAVWWVGNRLVEDRERACDEAVVESGREPQVYAESILKVCEFCVESPLPCVPGVSGADLKRRIASIMSNRPARAPSAGRKILLGVAIVLAIAAPILAGAFHVPTNLSAARLPSTTRTAPKYSSVTIAPSTNPSDTTRVTLMIGLDQFVSKNASLLQVIRQAYGVEDDRIANAPPWLTTDKYDFVATAGSPIAGQSLEASGQIQRDMLKGVLEDRLKLSAHLEARNVPVYTLVIAKNGPKLTASTASDLNSPSSHSPDSSGRRSGIQIHGTTLIGQNVPIDALLFHLSRQLHRTVLNETGLSGTYEFTLNAPDSVAIGIDNSAPPESYESDLSTALQEQLGLALEPRETKMQVLVIDHVERPTPNQTANATSSVAPSATFDSVSLKLDEQGTDSLRTGNGVIRQRMQLIPGEFHGENNSLREMVRMAYGIKDYQVFGAPDWMVTDLYDVDAKSQEAAVSALKKLPEDEGTAAGRAMLQQLLAYRFGMQAHFETKQLPAYALIVLAAGKIHPASGSCEPSAAGPRTLRTDQVPCGEITTVGPGRLAGTKAPIKQLAAYLSEITGRSVVDKTNLTARYDIALTWEPQYRVDRMPPLDRTEPSNPSLLAAIQNQLGLKLELETAPVTLLVIDRVQKPSETSARLR
jgi:bla regulator protein blaR1